MPVPRTAMHILNIRHIGTRQPVLHAKSCSAHADIERSEYRVLKPHPTKRSARVHGVACHGKILRPRLAAGWIQGERNSRAQELCCLRVSRYFAFGWIVAERLSFQLHRNVGQDARGGRDVALLDVGDRLAGCGDSIAARKSFMLAPSCGAQLEDRYPARSRLRDTRASFNNAVLYELLFPFPSGTKS